MAEIQVRVKTADDLPGPLGGPPIVHPTRSQTLQVPDDYLFLQGSTLGNTQFQELQRMPVGDRGLAIVGGRVTIQEGAVSRNPWTGNRIGTSGAQEALNDYKILMRRHNVPANMQSQRAMHDFSLYNRAHGVQRPRINVHSADAQARQEYTAGSEEVLGALLGGVGFKVGSLAIKGVGKGISWLAAKEAARRAAIEKGVEWTAGAGFAGMFGYHTAVSGGKNITDPWVGKVSDQAGLFSTLSGGMYPGPDIPLSSGLATGANRFMGMVAPFAIAMMGKQGWKEFRNRGKPTNSPMADKNESSRWEGGDNIQTKAITVKAFGTQKVDVSWMMTFKNSLTDRVPGFYANAAKLGTVFWSRLQATAEAGIHEIIHGIQSLISIDTGKGNFKYFEEFSRKFEQKAPVIASEIQKSYPEASAYTLGKEYQAFLFSEWLISRTGIPGLETSGYIAGRIQSASKRDNPKGLLEFAGKEIAKLFRMADEYGFGYLEGKNLDQLLAMQSKIQAKINYYEKNGYETFALEKRLAEVKDYIEDRTLPSGERAARYTGFEENLGHGVFRKGNDPANITTERGPTAQRPDARRDLATALGDLGIGIKVPEGQIRSLVREGIFYEGEKQLIRNQFQSMMDNQNPGGNPSREAGMRVIELAKQYKKAIAKWFLTGAEGDHQAAEAIRIEALAVIQQGTAGPNRPTFGLMEEPGPLIPPAVTVPPILGGTGTTGRQPEPAPAPAPAPATPEPKPRPDIKPFIPDPDFAPEIIPPEIKPPEIIPPEVKPPEVIPEVKPPEVIPEVKPPEVKPPEVVPEVKPPEPVPVPIVPVPDAPGVPPRPEIIAGVPRPGPRIQPGRVPLPVPALPIPLVPGPKPKRTTPTDIDFPGFDKSAGYWLPVAPSFHSGQWAYPGYIIDSGRLDYNVD